MQKELEELQPQLVETAAENDKMMVVCICVVYSIWCPQVVSSHKCLTLFAQFQSSRPKTTMSNKISILK